jgi:hypothetical protein
MSSRSKRSRSGKRRPSASGESATSTALHDVNARPAGRLEAERPEGSTSERLPSRIANAAARAREERLARRPQAGNSRRASRPAAHIPVSRRYGERPRAPWHPLPLSELLILVGAIGVVVGLRRGLSHGGPPLFAGIAAVACGTLEVTIREHRSGHRSHTIMLALLPVVIFHSIVTLIVSVFTPVPSALTLSLLGLDLLLFLALFRLLRTNFLTARTRAAGRG